MNRERLIQLAEHIRKLQHYTTFVHPFSTRETELNGFNMAYVAGTTDCGTAGCIAGHTLSLFTPTKDPNADLEMEEVGELLGLTPTQATELFMAPRRRLDEITPAEAADACLRVADGKEPWLPRPYPPRS